MFPQIKPAHRRAEPSSTAHLRAPVIPTSFPATTAAASGPGTWHGAAAPRPCEGAGALSYHLLAGARQGCHGMPGWRGTADHDRCARGSGGSQHPGHPSSDLAVTAALALRRCLQMRGVIHRRHSQDPKCFARRQQPAEGQRIRAQHPRQVLPGEAEAGADRGQRHQRDRAVQQHHENAPHNSASACQRRGSRTAGATRPAGADDSTVNLRSRYHPDRPSGR